MLGQLKRDLPHVMHEMIDNEVVVVNLTTGTYYSFDGVGVRIWEWLNGARSAAEVIELATRSFDAPSETVANAVRGFLNTLLEENLIAVGSCGINPLGAEATSGSDSVPPEASLTFSEPILQKYTDMEALLLADPIHEVDESAGWPHKQ
jgi:hypothetical protein